MRHAGRVALLAGAWLMASPLVAKKPRPGTADSIPQWAQDAVAKANPAAATVLHEEMIVEPLAAGGVRVTQRQVTRVGKESDVALVSAATVWFAAGDDLISHGVWTLLPDGSVRVPIPATDAFETAYTLEGVTLDDTRVHLVSVPAAAVGAVVVEESVVVHRLDLGAMQFTFGDDEATVAFARLEVRVPAGWSLDVAKRFGEGLVEQRSATSALIEGRHLVPLPFAEFRPPGGQVLPTAWVRWWSPDSARGFADWNAVARWSEALAAPQVARSGSVAPVAAKLAPASPADMLAALGRSHDLVARDVRYVALEIGIGGFQPSAPDDVLSKRHGDCKGKAWLLRAILERWGVTAHPVFVRTRDRGPVLDDVPTPAQFNHVIAGIVLPDGLGADLWSSTIVDIPGKGRQRLLFVDATAEDSDVFTLPSSDQGTRALVATPHGGVLVTLPTQPPQAAAMACSLVARLDGGLQVLEGSLTETRTGSGAASMRSANTGIGANDRSAWHARELQRRVPGARVVEHQVTGLDAVTGPVVSETKLAGGRFGRQAGTMLIVQPGSIAAGPLTVRLPPPPRDGALDMTVPRTESLDVTLSLADGFVPEALPAPVDVDTAHLAVRTKWEFASGRLSYHREAILKSREIPASDYASFRAALVQLQAQDAAAVVLVRP